MSKLLLRSALVLCIGSWSASAAFAQQVTITMNNGRVSLKATNATVRQILDEWARVGGTKVVNADKLGGQPVTLTLVDTPEGEALETVLRNAAGYMVSERTDPAPAASRYDRIMLMGRTTPVTATAANNNAYTANGPTPPGGNLQAEGPVTADDDNDPPQPTAPVVNPYAQAGAAPGTNGAPGVAGTNANGVPGMGTGLGQQQQAAAAAAAGQQQGVMPNPGYSNVYGQGNSGTATGMGTAGAQSAVGQGTINTGGNAPETKFDYANPQKYFQNRGQQQGSAAQPYPGVPMSATGSGTGTATPGTGAAGTITPQQVPNNQNPYGPNFNPYNLPAGGGIPSATPGTASAPAPVEPDRAKYANPYQQPQQQPQQ